MKKRHIIFFLIIVSLIFSGCREISIETIINSDGSFMRTITITGDSTDVVKQNLPYPIDDSWVSSFEKDSTQEKKFVQKYTKYFENDVLLNKEIKSDTSWRKQISRIIEIKKRFGFFYSYISYNETIGAANPFDELNYKDYLSNTDMLWLTGKKAAMNSADSAIVSEVEDRAEEYLKDSYSLEIINLLEEGIIDLDDPNIGVGLIAEYRDSILDKVDSWDYDSFKEFVDYFSELTNIPQIKKINTIKSKEIDKADKDMRFLFRVFDMEDYTVSVLSPGLLTNTNSPYVVGNNVQWKVNTMSFLFDDFQMTAESRVINYWMFVLAGVVLLALILTLVIRIK